MLQDIYPDPLNHTFPPEAGEFLCRAPSTAYISPSLRACICLPDWYGPQCDVFTPTVRPVKMVLDQIVYGSLNSGLFALSLVLFLVSLKDTGARRLVASYVSGALCLGLLLRFIFIVQPSQPNQHLAKIPKPLVDFSFWSAFALWLFAYTLILGTWLELLTNRIGILKFNTARRVATIVGFVWLTVVEGLLLVSVFFNDAIWAVWGIGMATLLTVAIVAFVTSRLVERRIAEIKESNGQMTFSHLQAERLSKWALVVSTIYISYLIVFVIYAVRTSMVSPLETAIQSGVMRIFDILLVFVAMSMNARVGVWDELVTAYYILRCKGASRMRKVRARSQSSDVGRVRSNSIMHSTISASDPPKTPRIGESASAQSQSSASISTDSRTPEPTRTVDSV